MPFAKRHSPTAYQMFTYTAVGAETSFTGSDDNSNTLSYDPATVVCYIDGVKLLAADYTATDGTNITGIAAMTAGQTFEAEAIGDSGNPIVSYTKTASDAKYALLGANSDITSLTGLTTPLSEAQGGTGLTSLPTSVVGDALVIAKLASQKNNVTGNNVKYTLTWDSEITDVGGDMSTGTFTAPTTGTYLVTLQISFTAPTETTATIYIDTSNRSWYSRGNPSASGMDGSNQFNLNISQLVDMDSADTLTTSGLINAGSQNRHVTAESYLSICQMS
ncbi:MAG: hypothetical protein HOE83_08450 [Alphaproteobacteria bacterium]|nr:hypothetical protein [Alphaproteobacteria bacterium]